MTSTLTPASASIRPLDELRASDTALAGGKGSNLGELRSFGIHVPNGFVLCAAAWVAVRGDDGLARLQSTFDGLDHHDDGDLRARCARAMELVRQLAIPDEIEQELLSRHAALTHGDGAVIVRSSATLEDTAAASFAGMNETFANVRGSDSLLAAVRSCWASLFAPRTVFYRAERGFPVAEAEIAVIVQQYVPARVSGVMFTRDATGETPDMVIEATLGTGEAIVSGIVTPDRYLVDPRTLDIATRDLHAKDVQVVDDRGGGTREVRVDASSRTAAAIDDDRVREVAAIGRSIENHYGSPQDIEWLVDPDGTTWVVQSRPVTTIGGGDASAHVGPISDAGPVLVQGVGASGGVAAGVARLLDSPEQAASLADGDILVARMTSPDWAPLMRRAAAIVTDAGGVTCHAAIVARELGIPCVVGTSDATSVLHDGQVVTIDGTRGTVRDGDVTAALRPAAAPAPSLAEGAAPAPVTATQVMANLSEPTQVERVAAMDCDGVGLLRAEVMVVDALQGVHPLEMVARGSADEATGMLAASIAAFCSAFAPRPVTYRTIDLRSNEFRRLEGGERHEPVEANPMIGFRGAGRYAHQPELLALELGALRDVLDAGHHNLRVMLPFVRTPADVRGCITAFDAAGLHPGDGFELWIMAEVPSVLWELETYRDLGIAGISIGTNDLTQLLLGVDRDSDLLTGYDATEPAVLAYIRELLTRANDLGLATSICGQAPAVYPGYVDVLVAAGIGSISVTPDALAHTRRLVARAEQKLLLDAAREQQG